jgi:hypothetical protein
MKKIKYVSPALSVIMLTMEGYLLDGSSTEGNRQSFDPADSSNGWEDEPW